MFKELDFVPLPGLTSPHVQMFLSNFSAAGQEPPSVVRLFSLPDNDKLSCHISTPQKWQPNEPTVVLVHGLGGSHKSRNIVRISRKLFNEGFRVVRVNLRGCGSGKGHNTRTYNSGNSEDVLAIIQQVKNESPHSPIYYVGYSLGGNIGLKMAGELGNHAHDIIHKMITICPPLDLDQSIKLFAQPHNKIYYDYYFKYVLRQGKQFVKDHSVSSIYEFDQKITAPLWGYSSAEDYYEKCSSKKYISNIKIPVDIVLVQDDPFIDPEAIKDLKISSKTNLWLSSKGGHMGFIGWAGQEHGIYWLDKLIMNWIAK